MSEALRAFFIGRFDDRSTFVYKALKDALDRHKATDRVLVLQKVNDKVAQKNLVTALSQFLNTSALIVGDITPLGFAENPIWNPNVFFELGISYQLGLPRFIICDKSWVNKLPFDIASIQVHSYDFTPDGLAAIGEMFANWILNNLDAVRGEIAAYEQSQGFVHAAREIKQALHKWEGQWSPSFRQLIARLMDPITKEVSRMTPFVKGDSVGEYEFKPPKRVAAIEHLFIAMMESLQSGDEYHTVSSLPFWLSFPNNGRDFLEVCRRAMDRGVVIRRLLVVPDVLEPREQEVVENHLSICRASVQKPAGKPYELRIVRKPRKEALMPRGHMGLCIRKAPPLTTVFYVDYDQDKVHPRVESIRLRARADDAVREFRDAWSLASELDLVDEERRAGAGKSSQKSAPRPKGASV